MARGKGAAADNRGPKAKRARLKRKSDMEKAEKLGTSVQPVRQRVCRRWSADILCDHLRLSSSFI